MFSASTNRPQQAATAKRQLGRTSRCPVRLAVHRCDHRQTASGQQVPVVSRYLHAGRVQLVNDYVTVEILRQK